MKPVSYYAKFRGRFAENVETKACGPIYSKAGKDSFKADLEHVCIENIQACIVIANICLADSDSKAESLYYGIQLLPTIPGSFMPVSMLI